MGSPCSVPSLEGNHEIAWFIDFEVRDFPRSGSYHALALCMCVTAGAGLPDRGNGHVASPSPAINIHHVCTSHLLRRTASRQVLAVSFLLTGCGEAWTDFIISVC
jgi:hypothetical protein